MIEKGTIVLILSNSGTSGGIGSGLLPPPLASTTIRMIMPITSTAIPK